MSRKINSRGYYNSEIDTLKKVVRKLKPGEIGPIHTFHPDKYNDLFARRSNRFQMERFLRCKV